MWKVPAGKLPAGCLTFSSLLGFFFCLLFPIMYTHTHTERERETETKSQYKTSIYKLKCTWCSVMIARELSLRY